MASVTVGAERPSFPTATMSVVFAVSICHFINDMMQSLLSSIYPILKAEYGLDFWQIGILTFAFQATASLLQPVVGIWTDKHPMPYLLPSGMVSTLAGLFVLAYAHHFPMLLLGASLIGIGSAIFHPEASRAARTASGGRFGLAQSIFQLGGNFGTAIGPLLAAFIVVPRGQTSVAWFSLAAILSILILSQVGAWSRRALAAAAKRKQVIHDHGLPRSKVVLALVVLALLTFTKNVYTASFISYFTFYVIEKFALTVQQAQYMLFIYLGAFALGTILGGPIGDRFGARRVIWFSILGALPFSLALPYADLFWTGVLSAIVGVVIASAFPAIMVFAQELVPGRVGMVAGIFFGLAFGIGGIAAAILGVVADAKGIEFVYAVCSFLPLLGLLTIFLPSLRHLRPVPGPARTSPAPH